jgi:hypothetical protein
MPRLHGLNFMIFRGFVFYKKKIETPQEGKNQVDYIDVSSLGSDIYSVRLKVKFVLEKKHTRFIVLASFARE